MAAPKKNEIVPATTVASTTPPAFTAPTTTAPPVDHLSPEETAVIQSYGRAFFKATWDGSNANNEMERIGKLLSPRLQGTGRALVNALRAPFGRSDGSLSVSGSYTESKALFQRLGADGMAAHFVNATRAVLRGEVLEAALGNRAGGGKRASL